MTLTHHRPWKSLKIDPRKDVGLLSEGSVTRKIRRQRFQEEGRVKAMRQMERNKNSVRTCTWSDIHGLGRA